MQRRLTTALAAGLALLFLPLTAGAADPAALLPNGGKAPLFDAVTIDGRPYVLEEEIPKGPVFLVFWSIF